MFANNSTNVTDAFINDDKTISRATHNTKSNYPSLVILGILVTLENFLVCLAFIINRKLRKRQANILVCSQAAVDLIIGLVFVPWKVTEEYTGKNMHTGYIIMYVLFVSLFNLFVLALDRYLALIKPLMHHLLMDVNRTKKLLLVIWLAPLVISMLPVFWHAAPLGTQMLAYKVYIYISWSVMLLLCIIMIFMYICIYRTAARTIRRRQKRMNNTSCARENRIKTTRKELRIAHLFGLLLFFFILAYLPILYLNLNLLLGHKNTNVMIQVSLYSLIVNSVVNPILCLLLKKDYQLLIKRWICFEWITERWRDESVRSQVSCKTGVDEMETTDSGSEARRKRLALTVRKTQQLDNCLKNAAGFKVRFQEDSVAFLRNKPLQKVDNGLEINGNKTLGLPSGDQRRQRISFKEQNSKTESSRMEKEDNVKDAPQNKGKRHMNNMKAKLSRKSSSLTNSTEKGKTKQKSTLKSPIIDDEVMGRKGEANGSTELSYYQDTEDDSQPILAK